MSYSFSVRGITKQLALAAAAAHFDEHVIGPMPIHKVDREVALTNVEQNLAIVADPAEGEEVVISMHGSAGGDVNWETGDVKRLTTTGSGCSVHVQQIPTAA